jgi:putative DNA primase/helicase
VQDESWRSQIPRTSSGTLDGSNVEGVRLYIAHHRLLTGRLRFNMLTREMELDGNPLEDHNVAEFRRLMHSERFKAKKGDVQDEMEAEARRNQFDPLLDYLAGLKWDGKKRIDLWLHRYLGVPDTDYCKTVGRRFLIGAVARAHAPPIGLKLDTMLVLEGPQGLGKSTALRYLFGDRFFVDELPDFHSKDSFLQLQGSWCVEVAELSALSKADVKDVKKFLSRLVDKYRPPYGRNPVQVPRRNVFAGTVNPEEGGYLRDPTGNRRFWPVECREVVAGMVDLSGILSDRDQLWAEALTAFRQGERWHLAEQEIQDAEAEQEARREKDPWEETIAAWLDEGARREVTCGDVLAGAIKMPAEKQEARHSRRIGAVMRALRWEPGSARIGSDKKPSKVFRHPEYAAEIRQFDYEG